MIKFIYSIESNLQYYARSLSQGWRCVWQSAGPNCQTLVQLPQKEKIILGINKAADLATVIFRPNGHYLENIRRGIIDKIQIAGLEEHLSQHCQLKKSDEVKILAKDLSGSNIIEGIKAEPGTVCRGMQLCFRSWWKLPALA